MSKRCRKQTAMLFGAFGALMLSASARVPAAQLDYFKPLIWSSQDRQLYAPDELPPERSDDFATARSGPLSSQEIIIDMDLADRVPLDHGR